MYVAVKAWALTCSICQRICLFCSITYGVTVLFCCPLTLWSISLCSDVDYVLNLILFFSTYKSLKAFHLSESFQPFMELNASSLPLGCCSFSVRIIDDVICYHSFSIFASPFRCCSSSDQHTSAWAHNLCLCLCPTKIHNRGSSRYFPGRDDTLLAVYQVTYTSCHIQVETELF